MKKKNKTKRNKIKQKKNEFTKSTVLRYFRFDDRGEINTEDNDDDDDDDDDDDTAGDAALADDDDVVVVVVVVVDVVVVNDDDDDDFSMMLDDIDDISKINLSPSANKLSKSTKLFKRISQMLCKLYYFFKV